MSRQMTKLMPWVGGKAQLMWAIQMLLPTHYKTLVDVFGGSGIASQWEWMPMHGNAKYTRLNANGSINRGYQYRLLRESNLKPVFIVRYADDFKLFCRNRKDAFCLYAATTQWLKERLKLDISPEKSKVVNLKRHYSEYLGFKMKAQRKGDKYVVRSHMSDKAQKRVKDQLAKCIKEIQHPKSEQDQRKQIFRYNSIVIGMHNYYRVATCVNLDFSPIAFAIGKQMKNRLGKQGLSKQGKLEKGYIKSKYGNSSQIRFLKGHPLIPAGYIRHKNPLGKKRSINRYTESGREEIHRMLGVNIEILTWLMEKPDLLILDEPTNALDEQGVAMIAQLIRKECQCGALVVVACHDADFVQSVSDVVIQIQAGRVTSVIGK